MATKIRIVQSVDKAITILECLAQSEIPMTLADLSKAAGIPKSTAHGLLYTMRLRGLIVQSESDGKYWLGKKLSEISNAERRYGEKSE